MSDRIYYPTTKKITTGARFAVALLPVNVRSPTSYTITVNSAFNSTTTPGTIQLRSNANVWLSPGLKLTFAGIQICVAEEVLVLTTATNVEILDLPPGRAISANTTTTTNALSLVAGCKDVNISPEIQTTDTSNVSHGSEKEEKHTFISKKLSFDLTETYGDRGGQLLKDMSLSLSYRNREFWFRVDYPDGGYHQGAAIITSASTTGALQSTRQVRGDCRIQPGTYSYG